MKLRRRICRSVRVGWRLDYGTVGGRRKQEAFETEEDAQAAMEAARKACRKPGHNALRHRFAGYHYAMHQNDALLQAQMGSSSAMLHRHYRALKTKAEARRFWALRPG